MLITSFPVVSAVKFLLLIEMSRCVGECIHETVFSGLLTDAC